MSPVSSEASSRGGRRYSWIGKQRSSHYYPGERRRRLQKSLLGVAMAQSQCTFHTNSSHSCIVNVPMLNNPDLRLRFLTPHDLDEVKLLCKDWFPIEYPDHWYTEITSNPKFYSVACVYHEQIVGLVVAQIKDYHRLPKEDTEILDRNFGQGTQIVYILSLGVREAYRKHGIASFMLENLLAHFTSMDHVEVRGVYLHVLTTNSQALSFYENRGFKPHRFLPYYYNIKGKRKDGFTYVLYINGGHPPWTAIDYLIQCCQMVVLLNPWKLTKNALRKLNLAWYHLTPRLRQIAQNSTAVFS